MSMLLICFTGEARQVKKAAMYDENRFGFKSVLSYKKIKIGTVEAKYG